MIFVKLVLEWLSDNKEWLFSGLGITFLGIIWNRLRKLKEHHDEIFDGYYLKFIEKVFDKLDVENYSLWTYYMAIDGNMMLEMLQYNNLHDVRDMLRRAVPHKKYKKLDQLFVNMAMIIEDLILVLDSHLIMRGDSYLTFDRFYKVPNPNPNYHEDLVKFNKLCYFIIDLTLELTRMSNLILDIVRQKRPGFMAEVGTLAISHARFKSFKYRKQEITSAPYPGLREFLSLRSTRAAYMDKSADLDIDNL